MGVGLQIHHPRFESGRRLFVSLSLARSERLGGAPDGVAAVGYRLGHGSVSLFEERMGTQPLQHYNATVSCV